MPRRTRPTRRRSKPRHRRAEAPVVPDEGVLLEAYARELVARGLASPQILTRPRSEQP